MNRAVTQNQRPSKPTVRPPFRSLFGRSIFDDYFDHYLTEAGENASALMNVSMDVAETDQSFEVKVDLPGIDPDKVDIQIDNNTLTIRGIRIDESEDKDEDKQFHRVERYQGSFSRSVVLPTSINEDETAAEFRDGVLKIVIPKSEEAKPRRISISR
jgi:HSP20 family protein